MAIERSDEENGASIKLQAPLYDLIRYAQLFSARGCHISAAGAPLMQMALITRQSHPFVLCCSVNRATIMIARYTLSNKEKQPASDRCFVHQSRAKQGASWDAWRDNWELGNLLRGSQTSQTVRKKSTQLSWRSKGKQRPPLWSSAQSSWLQNGDVLFLARYELNLYVI
jgi:hypothetical protein